MLLTIPGFGPYIAALVLAALADPFRFASRKQVIRLAGLDLNASRSGKKSQDSVPVISKKGDADLRYGLYQAALIASYHNDGFRRVYHRMIENRGGERGINPNVAKVGGLQSQGDNGAAVVDLLQALGNAGSGALRLSRRGKKMA